MGRGRGAAGKVVLGSALAVALALPAAPAWARGGGGCIEEGTPVATARGPVPIEALRAGDEVLAPAPGGGLRAARVLWTSRVEPEEYVEVGAAGRVLRATAEHPIAVGPGAFRRAGALAPGDRALVLDGRSLAAAPLDPPRRVPAARPARDLAVEGGTFIAAGVAVHNKGCFLPDTPVLRADGSWAAIGTLRPGDRLRAFTDGGSIVEAAVVEVIAHDVEEYVLVEAEGIVLRVTREHPFCVGGGNFRTLAALRPGDRVLAFDGKGLSPRKILSIESVRAPARVYDLRTDAPHTFFAHGIAVHNKGGCFPAGTDVLTPAGERPIDALGPGDRVVAVDGRGRAVETAVVDILAVRRPVLVLETDRGPLAVTEDHPIALGDGRFAAAGAIPAGTGVLALRDGRLETARVLAVRREPGDRLAFNLRAGAPHTFVARGVVVHNKGGCFPAGTDVLTPAGERPIDALGPGDRVVAVDGRGRAVEAAVADILAVRRPVLVVETDRGPLAVTEDHPIALGDGRFAAAGSLPAGAEVRALRGGGVGTARVLAVRREPGDRLAFNLRAGAPHTFVARGVVVHNKGGFGGGFHGHSYGHGSGSGGSGDMPDGLKIFFVLFIIGIIVLVAIEKVRRPDKADQDLDFTYRPRAVEAKAAKTEKLLEFIARTDPAFRPYDLRTTARGVFRKLQGCWESREYEPMKPLLVPDLYAQHWAQIQAMARDHEIDRIEGLQIERIDLVNVRYGEKAGDREFTALITARARDYYVDDRTGAFLRGDRQPARFQEFWTFQREGDRWLLREIEQSRESAKLTEENFFEPFTDRGVAEVYGKEAEKEGERGPWLEKETATKAQRIDRLLNFLVRTDKLWDRPAMIETARRTFLRVYLARTGGDPAAVPRDLLFPDVAASLENEIRRRKEVGLSLELRNLCVRKAELILVQNYADNSRDAFTVRISAHAQRVVRKDGQPVSEDEDVAPFEEYWTFGRLDGAWKLKEVLPPGRGKQAAARENVDEESTPEQLDWFYRQTRAQ